MMGRRRRRSPATILALFVVAAAFAAAASGEEEFPTISFDEGYSPLFGDGNLIRSVDGRSVVLLLDRFSGSGFISSETYDHGFFSAAIKLPSDYTAGIVVAFYASNGDVFEKTHDELDFEFLVNVRSRPWRLQTNVYGNGSTSRGREERYTLPFDPSKETHRYSIFWTSRTIMQDSLTSARNKADERPRCRFSIDDTPIREVRRSSGGDYPSKPMSIYATIWDASNWATSGGKYKVDYRGAPFVASFSNLVLLGSGSGAGEELDAAAAADGRGEISPERRRAMRAFRERHVTYSVCYDVLRYPYGLPDCEIVPSEKARFRETGRLRIAGRRSRIRRRSSDSGAGGRRRSAREGGD